MFSCPGETNLIHCPVRSITCNFSSPQRSHGSDKLAVSNMRSNICPILWVGKDRASPDAELERVSLKRHECTESLYWPPGSSCDLLRGEGCAAFVYCLLPTPSRRATFTSREKDPTSTICWAGTGPWCSPVTKEMDIWAAGDMDVQACLWLLALGESIDQHWQRVLN